METCLFQGTRICSLDLIDEFEHKNTVLEKEWRLAGQNGELKCEECGTEVILKFGSIKIPHFAHKFDSSNSCFYKNYPESEERRNANQPTIPVWLSCGLIYTVKPGKKHLS